MARVQYGALVTEITGSIGGMTFQNSKSGFTVRLKPSMSRYYSANQTPHIQLLNTISYYWRKLTLIQQLAWDNLAAANIHTNIYGRQYYLSGFNLFSSVNFNLNLIGELGILNPPVFTAAEPLPVITPQFDEHGLFINLDNLYSGLADRMVIFSTPPIFSTRSKNLNKYLFTTYITAEEFLTYEFTADWNNTHNLDYASIHGAGNFHVSLKIISINKTSGRFTPAAFLIGEDIS